jgi:hypothetical protein
LLGQEADVLRNRQQKKDDVAAKRKKQQRRKDVMEAQKLKKRISKLPKLSSDIPF